MLEGMTWIVALLAVTAGMVVFLSAVPVLLRRHEVSARLSHLFAPDRAHTTAFDTILRGLERAGRSIEGARINRGLRALVLRAGFFQPSVLYVFVALRYAIAVVVCIGVVVARFGAHGVSLFDILLGLFFGYLFYRYALIGLKVYADRRANVIRREMPPVLDVMLMALDAGVSIDQCMRYVATVAARTAPVTSEVLRRHITDIDGGMPYDAALDRLGQRLGLDEGQDLAATIKQALFQGGELGTTLRRFSADLTDKRMATAREQVGRKAPHLTLVMIVFFMPVLLVVLAGPAVVELKAALQSAGEQMAKSRTPK
ncbi:MAG: type II secretion system F family protein [Parvibaculum sp.]|uniref:type II secretion system F family protein n=1 Tax=Parvibaculum sp. TaxID=2024848 RepID=UPI002ABBD5FF|nr:type II secretion system F family protein [Parvibaculum sp.]MDZ4380993.1 type II secretion system F family protein [Parvibaculum sp.]